MTLGPINKVQAAYQPAADATNARVAEALVPGQTQPVRAVTFATRARKLQAGPTGHMEYAPDSGTILDCRV